MRWKKGSVFLIIIWAVLTVAGIAVAMAVEIFPSPASQEAHVIDDAMTLLAVLSVPVFTMVLVLLVYSAIRFRQRGEPTEDGPPVGGNRPLEITWLSVTLALTLYLAWYGAQGLMEIRDHGAEAARHEELVIEAKGNQWFWEFYYPEQGIRIKEKEQLYLPVGSRVRFEITASDVLHSFWVPAFRTKIDAVPGLVTTVYATPDRTGDFQKDYNFRVQCAELCGLGHAVMATPVVVVESSEFQAWVDQHKTKK